MEKIQGALEAESNWIEEDSWGETYKVRCNEGVDDVIIGFFKNHYKKHSTFNSYYQF